MTSVSMISMTLSPLSHERLLPFDFVRILFELQITFVSADRTKCTRRQVRPSEESLTALFILPQELNSPLSLEAGVLAQVWK